MFSSQYPFFHVIFCSFLNTDVIFCVMLNDKLCLSIKLGYHLKLFFFVFFRKLICISTGLIKMPLVLRSFSQYICILFRFPLLAIFDDSIGRPLNLFNFYERILVLENPVCQTVLYFLFISIWLFFSVLVHDDYLVKLYKLMDIIPRR